MPSSGINTERNSFVTFCKLVPVLQGLSDEDQRPVSVPATLYEHLILPSLSRLESKTESCLVISRKAKIV